MISKFKEFWAKQKENLSKLKKGHGFFSKRKRPKRTHYITDIQADETSSIKQKEYLYPERLVDLLKHGSKRFHQIFKKNNADEYNAGMLDTLIDNEIDLAIMSIKEQFIQHMSAIKDLLRGQKSRISSFEQEISNCSKEMDEIHDKYPEISIADPRYTSKRLNSRIPFYKKKWCLFVVIGISCTLDFTTIYSSVDSLLTQNAFLSTLLSIGTAMLINISPSIAGVYAKNKYAENKKTVLIMLGAIFIVLFVILFGLRWATRDALYTDTSILFASADTAKSNTLAELFMTILLSAEPALTSAMSFVFGFIGATEEEKERDLAEIHFSELYAKRDALSIHVEELKDVVEKNQNALDEEEQYNAQLELMEKYRVYLKELARIELSQIVANPQGNGIVLQREDAILFES